MAKAGSLYKQKKSPYWWIKFYVPGQKEPIRESTKTTDEDEAQRYLWRRLGEVAVGKFAGLEPERIKVGNLLDYLLEDYEQRGNRSYTQAELRIRLHLRPFFGNLYASKVGTREINAYISHRRKGGTMVNKQKKKRPAKPASNATINRDLELLRRAFNLGFKAEPQMVSKPLKVSKLPEENTRQGLLEHPDYLRLRDSLPQNYQLLLVCGYHLGTRLGELIKLKWENVDFARKEITIIAANSKSKKPRVVPIYGEMEQFLQMAKEARDLEAPKCPWVMRSASGTSRLTFAWKTWKRFVKAAGVPKLVFHDLRRTALTNMMDAGFSEKEAMAISGHQTDATFRRYHIIRRQRLQILGGRLGEYLEEQTKAWIDAEKTADILRTNTATAGMPGMPSSMPGASLTNGSGINDLPGPSGKLN